jgi:hypothetical protein
MGYNTSMSTFPLRLPPTRAQRQHLVACLGESRASYYEMLVAPPAQYETDGMFHARYNRTAHARCKGRCGEHVPAVTVQTPTRSTTRHRHQRGACGQKGLSAWTHVCLTCGQVADDEANAAKHNLQTGINVSDRVGHLLGGRGGTPPWWKRAAPPARCGALSP